MYQNEAFKMLSHGEKAPKGYQFALLHMICDGKEEGIGKARFIAGGHVVNASKYAINTSVLKSEHFRMLLTVVNANRLNFIIGDIGGTRNITPLENRRLYSIAGPQFKKDQRRIILIGKELSGLKTSAERRWQHLASTLPSMGFHTNLVDDIVWMYPVYDDEYNIIRYDYIRMHVDNFSIIAEDVSQYVTALQKIYITQYVTPIFDILSWYGVATRYVFLRVQNWC